MGAVEDKNMLVSLSVLRLKSLGELGSSSQVVRF